jgi:hypothetical protein
MDDIRSLVIVKGSLYRFYGDYSETPMVGVGGTNDRVKVALVNASAGL